MKGRREFQRKWAEKRWWKGKKGRILTEGQRAENVFEKRIQFSRESFEEREI